MEICCQNTVALMVEYDRELHVFTKILDRPNEQLAPFGARDGSGQINRGTLTSWWHSRAIPFTRDGFNALKMTLDGVDPLDLLDHSLGLSLSDQFWMRETGSDTRWEDVNFFDNAFSDQLGLITLGSYGSAVDDLLSQGSRSPNSSLGGNLKKAWERRGNQTVLVKAGSLPNEQEPVNELIATRLYERVLDPADYVPYGLEVRDGHPYSVCPNMVSRDECLIPAWDIINASKRPGHQSPWMHLLNCYERLGLADAEHQLTKMFVCDYLIANEDRHWNNLGVIFDARTMQAKRVAPIFDSGSSLYFRAPELTVPADFWYDPLPLMRTRAHRIYPEDQLSLMQDYSWLNVDALQGFDAEVGELLAQHTRLPQERIEAIAKRVGENITVVSQRAYRAQVE